jgi:hypothetical protein
MQMRALHYDFDMAVARMPRCLGGFDPVGQHKTLADLRFMAQTQVDLYHEGEVSDISSTRQLHAVKGYISALEHSIEPCGVTRLPEPLGL